MTEPPAPGALRAHLDDALGASSASPRTDPDDTVVSAAALGMLAERMFEPFVSNKPDGAGLGLALAQQAAGQHNGTLTWQRRAGRTEFTLSLAARPAKAP